MTDFCLKEHTKFWEDKNIQGLDYADSLSVLNKNIRNFNSFLEFWEVQGARIGLKINAKKIQRLQLGTS